MKFVIRGIALVGVGYGVGYVQGMKTGVNTGRVLEELGRGMQALAKEMAIEKEQRQAQEGDTTENNIVTNVDTPENRQKVIEDLEVQ